MKILLELPLPECPPEVVTRLPDDPEATASVLPPALVEAEAPSVWEEDGSCDCALPSGDEEVPWPAPASSPRASRLVTWTFSLHKGQVE